MNVPRAPRVMPLCVLLCVAIILLSCGGGGGGSSPAPQPTPTPSLSLSPTTLSFGNQPVSTSTSTSVTVTNKGDATLTVSNATLSGANAAEFSFSPSTFPINVSPGASVTVNVSFKPAGEGARTATLTISDNASGNPHSVTLTGTGTAPHISASTSAITFSSTLPNTTSAPISLTISNPGTADLVISSLAISGTNASEFHANASSTPITVAPNGSTTIQVTFTPTGSGTRTGSLNLQSNASSTPLLIALSGTSPSLEQDPRAAVTLSPNNADAGSTVTVNLAGTFTNFVEGATVANFGPGIAVADAAAGQFGVVTVTSPTNASAQVKIDALASATPRVVLVRTGTHTSAATFVVTSTTPGPLANAGPPQVVKVGDVVRLDGSASTGSPLVFHWSFLSVPDGSTAVLSDASSVNPTFMADAPGMYLVQLTVQNGSSSAMGWVIITTGNSAPVANAGPDKFVGVGNHVQLDGSGSTDGDGDTLTYLWEIVSQPTGSGASLSSATDITPSFIVDLAGSYVFQLTVNDGHGNTATDTVTISTIGTPPNAIAGPDQQGLVGVLVQLDGSASSDPDGNTLSFLWSFVTRPPGSTAQLTGAATATSTFTPDLTGTYLLELKVTDSDGNISLATMTVNVGSNTRPVANAGAHQQVNAGPSTTVQLDGSASSDADNDPLTYSWSLLSKPTNSVAVLTGATTSSPTFIADVRGDYVAQLIVSDGNLSSLPATVLITAVAPDIALAPPSLSFAAQLVGTTSGSQSIVITNTGTADLIISGAVISGTNASEFHANTSSPPILVVPGNTTTINVTFTPSGTGPRNAVLQISDNAGSGSHSVPLAGTGIAPAFDASPSPLNFGNQNVGTNGTATLIINNPGSAQLSISGIAITGTNAADFSFTTTPTFPITVDPGNTQSLSLKFTPAAKGNRTATLNFTDNASGSPHPVSLLGNGTAPTFGIAPASLAFGNQQVSTTSPPSLLTISNTGDGTLKITNIVLSGLNSTDFTVTSATPPFTVAPGASTTISVTFSPTALNARVAALTITHDATGSPQVVNLSGTGTQPAFSIAPPSLDFGNQLLTVQSSARTLTITNTGTAPLEISSLTLTGANATEFGFTGSVPITVAPNGTSTVQVTFTPAALGTRTATLSIGDNAGGPHTVNLQGKGVAPGFSAAPAPLSFASQLVNTTSTVQTVTVTNNGTADLVISGVAISGANAAEFALSPAPTVPATVPPAGTFTVSLTFTPANTGARTASLNFTDNASGSPHSVTLSGTGIAPAASLSATTLTFANQNVGTTSPTQQIIVTNSGTANLVISGIALAGTNPGDFGFTAATRPITVGANTSTTINVTFSPAATGARSATLLITDNASGSPRSISLSGTGTTPGFSPSASSFDFGNQNVGTTSSASSLTITNTGTGDLTITSVALLGVNTSDFAFAFTPAVTLPVTIAPGAAKTLNLTFTPSATGPRTATLRFADNASSSPHDIPLSGKGTQPGFSPNPISLNFGSQNIGTTSTARTVTITNSGDGVLHITNVSVTGNDFLLSAVTLPIDVQPGASTTVNVSFKPLLTGLRTGTLTITDNASGSPHAIAMSGTGTAPIVNVTPSALVFASQQKNTTSAAQVVHIRNTGDGTLIVSSISVTGAQAADFAAVPAASLPITVAPNSETTVSVTFTPTGEGARSAALVISDDAAGSPHQIPLSGTGVAPLINFSPTSLTFASQSVNTSATQTILISNPGSATLVISSISLTGPNASDFSHNAVIPPAGMTISPGNSVILTVTFTPVGSGTRTATLSFADNAEGSPHTVSLTGAATARGRFNTIPAFSVGRNLEIAATGSVDVSAPAGGLAVQITSSDPTKLLFATDPTVAGQAGITATIPQGFFSIPTGFYVQALDSSGTVQVTLSAVGYVKTTATVALTPAGFIVSGGSFSINTSSADRNISLQPAQLDPASLTVIPGSVAVLRGGISVTVPVTSANTAVGTILNSPASFQGGSSSGTSVVFHPVAPGTSTVSIGTPSIAGFSTPASGASITATVTQPHITLSQMTVGANLQDTGAGVLEAAAPTGGVAVTITSADPTKVKLTTNPALDGTASVTVTVPEGSTVLPTFYVQGLASAGTVQLTASATGYANGTAQVSLLPSGFVLSGPSGVPGDPFSTTTISSPSALPVGLVLLDPTTLAPVPGSTAALRGGISVNISVTSGNTTVGTITNNPAIFQTGVSTVSTLRFQPNAAGTSTLSLGTPSIAGFSTPPAAYTQVVATVSAPSISFTSSTLTVGANLEASSSGVLSAPAPIGGLQVTITSDNPAVLLSSDITGASAGTQSITVTVAEGQGVQGRGFPLFWVQALNTSGSAHLTASSTTPGWTSATMTVNMTPSGFTLASSNGIAADFGVLLGSSGPSPTLPIQSWQLDPVTLARGANQPVRGGVSVLVNVSSGNTTVGTIPDSPATLTGGADFGFVTFHPLAVGSSLLTVAQPAGFSAPITTGNRSEAQLTVQVN